MRVSGSTRVEVLDVGMEPSRPAGGRPSEAFSDQVACAFVIGRSDISLIRRVLSRANVMGVEPLAIIQPGAVVPGADVKCVTVQVGERLGAFRGLIAGIASCLSLQPQAGWIVVCQDDCLLAPYAFDELTRKPVETRICSLYTPDHVADLIHRTWRWQALPPPQGGHMSAVGLAFRRDLAIELIRDAGRLEATLPEDGRGTDRALADWLRERGEDISYMVPSAAQHVGEPSLLHPDAPVRRASTYRELPEVPFDVIIPYRDWSIERLRHTVLGMLAGSVKPRQVIIVDYGSVRDREALAELARTAGVTLVRAEAPLFRRGHANNIGILHSTAPVVAVCDSDCVPSRRLFERCIEVLVREKFRCCVLCDFYDAPKHYGGAVLEGQPDWPKRSRRSQGGLLMARVDAILRLGGYDERFVVWGAEDNDLVERLSEDGFPPVWVTDRYEDAFMVHQWHESSPHLVLRNDDLRAAWQENRRMYITPIGHLRAGPGRWSIAVMINSFGRIRSLRRAIRSVLRHCPLAPRLYVGWSGEDTDDWQDLARELRRGGHVALTLPFACPQGMAWNRIWSQVDEPIVFSLDDDMWLDDESHVERAIEGLLAGWDVVTFRLRGSRSHDIWIGRVERDGARVRIVGPGDPAWIGRWRGRRIDMGPNVWVARSWVIKTTRQYDHLTHYGHHLHWFMTLKAADARVGYILDASINHEWEGEEDERYRAHRRRRGISPILFTRLTGIEEVVSPAGRVTRYGDATDSGSRRGP